MRMRVRSTIAGSFSIKVLARGAAIAAMVALSACSMVQQAGFTAPAPAAGAHSQERVGTGATLIGVVTWLEAANFSDGAPDSIALAAKLAASTLTNDPATIDIRMLPADERASRQAAEELVKLGARIVIAGNDGRQSNAAASVLGRAGIPTLSVATLADTGTRLYGAGQTSGDEAAALVAECLRLGYKSLAIVSLPTAASQGFGSAVVRIASENGIAVRGVDASVVATLADSVKSAGPDGGPPTALLFATGPQHAAQIVADLQAAGALGAIKIVGNSGWATAEPLPANLKSSWYPSLPRERLAQFVSKFRAAYGVTPTIQAAIAYDLVILAAALPQALPDAPYAPEVLSNAEGFNGYSGAFRFGQTNMVERRSYVIVPAR